MVKQLRHLCASHGNCDPPRADLSFQYQRVIPGDAKQVFVVSQGEYLGFVGYTTSYIADGFTESYDTERVGQMIRLSADQVWLPLWLLQW